MNDTKLNMLHARKIDNGAKDWKAALDELIENK